MKSRIIIGMAFLLFANMLSAQATYCKPTDFALIKKRTLLVELMELDNDKIQDWEKDIRKTKKADKKKDLAATIVEYKAFVENYNTFIKLAVEKYWDLNTTIEYKTNSEVIKLRKTTKKKYSVLWYSASRAKGGVDFASTYSSEQFIPTLNYGRIEKGRIKVDYSFFMPSMGERSHNELVLGDFLFSLKMMKTHIAAIEKKGKKNYNFKKYATEQGELNCKKISGNDLYLLEGTLHKNTSLGQIKSSYRKGKAVIYNNEELDKAIIDEDDIIVGYLIPYQIAMGSAGFVAVERTLYFRIFVNIKSGEILAARGVSYGDLNDEFFHKKDFSTIAKCK